MPTYLKIENVGVCPPDGFTVLGVSLADMTDQQGVTGQFGSGNRHGVAVCLRHEVAPVVFCGSLRLEFFTKPQTVSDAQASQNFVRVCVIYGCTDPVSGTSRSSTVRSRLRQTGLGRDFEGEQGNRREICTFRAS